MKTTKKLFVVGILFILLVLIGCSKPSDPTPIPPVPAELTPKIEATITPSGVIDYEGSFTVTWNIKNFKSGTLNGDAISATGNKVFDNVIYDTDIDIYALNETKEARFTKTVSVGEEPTPSVEVNITPTDIVIPYNDTIVVHYKGDINTKKISINGVDMPDTEGEAKYPDVRETTTYTVVATNDTKTATVAVTVNVGDWTTSTYGIITHGYWRVTSNYLVSHTPDGDITYTTIFTPEDLAEQWYFKDDGTYEVHNPDGSQVGSSSTWHLNADSTQFIFWIADPYDIIEINQDKFVLFREETFQDMPATTYNVFER